MRILVTGGAGFIGSHVVEQLANRGDRVMVLDAKARGASNWTLLEEWIGFDLFQGDVANADDVRRMLDFPAKVCPFDLVLHLAAESHVDASLKAPAEAMRTNAVGTQVVASACAERDIPLVYVSTDEVYGDVAEGSWWTCGAREDETPTNPSSPYSAGKLGGEAAVRAAARSFGLRACILRGTNAFGPRQLTEKLVPIACTLLQRGEPVPLHGGGLQVRQWLAVEAFADAIVRVGDMLAGHRLLAAPRQVPCFNVGGPTLCSVRGVVEALARVAGWEDPRQAWRAVPDRPGQDGGYHVDGGRLRAVLPDWSPGPVVTDAAVLEGLLRAYAGAERVLLADHARGAA